MNIILSGASGLLGSAVQTEANILGLRCVGLSHREVWQLSIAELAERLRGFDLVVHAAANTDVEQCEIDVSSCYRDNLLLTELLAQAALLAGVRVVFISSTGIYGETQSEPYAEYAAVAPTTHHHTSKYLAEQAVLRLNPLNLIVRTGWLFGGALSSRKNFVAQRVKEASAALLGSGIIQSNAEQHGVPSYTTEVARRILRLATVGHSGVFNCVNSGRASRFEYVCAIVKQYGLAVEVQPADAAGFNRRARVSRNEMATNWRMDCLGFPPMPDWRISLEEYIDTLMTEVAK